MYNSQLETFIQVAEAGSFSKAANKLFISTAAVIKQINLLESNLDVKLFIRTHQGVNLTEAGKSMYKDANYVIGYSKDSIKRAKNAMDKDENVIRIGTSLMTPCQFLIDLWPSIQKYCPEIKIKLVPFDNTPENAREILKNLGQNIDVVAGVFDENFLEERGCTTLELSRVSICCGVSLEHPLSGKNILTMEDLLGQRLLLIHRGWNRYVDMLRDDLWQHYPEIAIEDFSFYDVDIFNQCEIGSGLLMAIESWQSVHPLLKIIPVEWEHVIPFGLLYSPKPSRQVDRFIKVVGKVFGINE